MEPVRRRVWRGSNSEPLTPFEDELAVEEPLEIQVESRPVSVTLRTPGHDDELAVGFLISEGVIRSVDQIQAIRPYPRNPAGNAINVFLTQGVSIDFAKLTRHVFASSSCGLCGKASIEAIRAQFPPLQTGLCIEAATLPTLPPQMRQEQDTFARTGGLHAAALFTLDGQMRVLREDIGRHNAMDKIIGYALMQKSIDLSQSIALVSGRASFEIMQKALAAGIPVVAAVSAPSNLAVEFAESNGQILVGFLREDRFNVYAGADRVRARASVV